ncbi:hypothetical protein VPH35_003628 [Triticum aestivum]
MSDMAFQTLEAFKAQHADKPFTLTHCWTIIKDCPKCKEQYVAEKKNGGSAAGVGHEDRVKRPRGKTNSKLDEKRDAASFALQETLQDMVAQKEARGERKRQEKEEKMKAYIELQTKKLEMEKDIKRRKLEIEEVIQMKKLEIEATHANTKAKEMALAFIAKQMEIMMVDLSKMSPKRRICSKKKQKMMLELDD